MTYPHNQLLNEITSCEVCDSNKLERVLDLGRHSMCDDLITIGDVKRTEKFPIEILFCDKCKTAHQRYQIPKKTLFPKSYHYRAALTKDVLKGMDELVASCEAISGSVIHKKVLDIGCNDGSLLTKFMEKGAVTYGIEPTDAAADAIIKKHTVVQDFFGEAAAKRFLSEHGHPDIITFTNVFAHIENLGDVLSGLDILMQATPSHLIVENHYLGAVLAQNQFDTFYHEHPRTYSYTSFKYIADSLNAQLVGLEFPQRYAGNIRVFISRSPNDPKILVNDADVEAREKAFTEGFAQLNADMMRWRKTKSEELSQYFDKHGKLRAKAFPGRAAIILELLKLNEEHISAVYEQPASPKVGHYVPGTRIPIISDDELNISDPAPIINLAWHIQAEISAYLGTLGFDGQVVPIINR